MKNKHIAGIVLLLLAAFMLACTGSANAEGEGWMSRFEPTPGAEILDYIETQELFASLSDKTLLACSGAGAWEAQLNVDASGGFEGWYYDADAGDEVIYECSFSGCFAANAEVHGYQYWLWVDQLTTAQAPGTEATSIYGDRIEYTDAPFRQGQFMVLTLIQTPADQIPEMVRGEIGGTDGEWEDYSRYVTLTRQDDGWGFFADGYESNRTDPEPIPTAVPDSGTDAGSPSGETPVPAADGTGYWMTGDDTQGELVITANEDGTLHMKVFFLRTFDLEADLKKADDSLYLFETAYGHYYGDLTRAEDGTMWLAVTGGLSMEDDENEYYYLLRDQEHVFRPAQYEELWYEAPAEGPEDDADWTGEWAASDGGMESTLRISGNAQDGFVLQLAFSNGYTVTGGLEQVDGRRMDFDGEDFGAILTLNRKHRAILLTDAGSMNDAANDALDAFHYVIEYLYEQNE